MTSETDSFPNVFDQFSSTFLSFEPRAHRIQFCLGYFSLGPPSWIVSLTNVQGKVIASKAWTLRGLTVFQPSGAGKITLIKKIFNIESLQVSTGDGDPRKCDVEDEITSSQNERFVLHNSDFEASEVDSFNKVKTFIEKRSKERLVKDRIHVIWLCLQIPAAGDRLFEGNDEEILKLPFGEVPVVVVFTQVDRIYDQLSHDLAGQLEKMDPNERKKLMEEKVEYHIQTTCVRPLLNFGFYGWCVYVSSLGQMEYLHTLERLLQATLGPLDFYSLQSMCINSRPSEWVLLAMAQRVHVGANLRGGMNVGMRKYWRGLVVGTHFAYRPLEDCLNLLQDDIVNVWNLRDDNKILQQKSFKAAVFLLAQGPSLGPGFDINLRDVEAALGTVTATSERPDSLGTTVVEPTGLAAISAILVRLSSTRHTTMCIPRITTPEILRCLIGYIIDLTVMMEILFWFKVVQPQPPSLCPDDIDAAFGLYCGSASYTKIHKQIRNTVGSLAFDYQKPDDQTHDVVENLIYRFWTHVLRGSTFVDARKGRPSMEELPPPYDSQSPAYSTVDPLMQSESKNTDETTISTPKKDSWLSRFFDRFKK